MTEIEKQQYQAAAVILSSLIIRQGYSADSVGLLCMTAAGLARGLAFQVENPTPGYSYEPPPQADN